MMWPKLSYTEWQPTMDTLHMWTQMVGKTKLALNPMENQWWQVPLFVSPRGLTTHAIPYQGNYFEMEFDFLHDALDIWTADDSGHVGLYPRTVKDFYAEYQSVLADLGIHVPIDPQPIEFANPIRFDLDDKNKYYDSLLVADFFRILTNCDMIFKKFRCDFQGKCSPVSFWWGSFDLSSSRFSGKPAPKKKNAHIIEAEAYSQELSCVGFWPGDARFQKPAFFAYTYPAPNGYDAFPVNPTPAYFDHQMGEFIMEYDVVRGSNANNLITEFCQSTYDAGTRAWDQALLRAQK